MAPVATVAAAAVAATTVAATTVGADAQPGWQAFPAGRPFPPLLADPHEPGLGAEIVEAGLVSARVGRYVGLVGRTRKGGWDTRLGVDALVWAWLDKLPGFNFPMETVDGSFGLPAEAVKGPWGVRLRAGHLSSHYADGTINILKKRVTYTREMVSLLGSYDAAARGGPARVYAGPAFYVHALPRTQSFSFQLGGQVCLPGGRMEPSGARGRRLEPYAALDLKTRAENAYRVNQSYQLGAQLNGRSGRTIRLAAGYFHGVSERGQRWRHAESEFSFGLFFGD